jgi:hypothetical protein
MEIFDAFIDLEVFPVRDIPQLLRSTQEVLASVGLILEHL